MDVDDVAKMAENSSYATYDTSDTHDFRSNFTIAINPARQFDRANDTKRMSDVSALQNAIAQYEVTNGVLPEGITEQSMEVAKNGADICAALVPTEIAALPTDPDSTYAGANILTEDCNSDYSTGYYVAINDMGEVVVTAPNTTE